MDLKRTLAKKLNRLNIKGRPAVGHTEPLITPQRSPLGHPATPSTGQPSDVDYFYSISFEDAKADAQEDRPNVSPGVSAGIQPTRTPSTPPVPQKLQSPLTPTSPPRAAGPLALDCELQKVSSAPIVTEESVALEADADRMARQILRKVEDEDKKHLHGWAI